MKDDDDSWCYDQDKLKVMVLDSYTQLYTDPNPVNAAFLPPLCDSWKLSRTDQEALSLTVTLDEVRGAVFDMNPNKSPGIDGFTAAFFHKACFLVGDSLLNLINSALRDGMVDPALNRTLVVLIPKLQGPEKISQFRPISLCTVPLKIITKLLLDRLRPFLSKLVNKTQSNFLPGRHTTGNIIVVQEALHTMRKMKRKNGAIAIKVDLEKAYDRIKWSFLQQVLGVL